ncbi:MAG: serine hydrolase [Ardenticatenaceae bacterium]|nr:serine hydrolase [Anaerolineales bacterium]MCB8922681.1 serine hydrolase [Ardenticatenaceae bacterium]MCB8991772.1 serine hydrolase [Ardenticatenaceae bacterium]MCB9003611.1 serine hydrolase [Ardenticatenaceae bacterium]
MTLLSQLQAICDEFNGRIALHALNLQTNAEISVNDADELYPTASAIKLAVLTTLMQQVEDGRYTLDAPLMMRRADYIEGSGVLRYLSPGLTMSLRDWAFLMMHISDNLATNVLIDHVGLPNVAAWLEAHQFDGVHLHHKLDFAGVRQDQDHFGTASPQGLGRLLTAVFRHEIISPAACDEMLRMMDKVGQDRVGRYLPWEPWEAEEPPEGKLRLAGKTGSFVGTRTQTAVIWRGERAAMRGFVLTVMNRDNPEPETWSIDAPGTLIIGRIARVLYDHWLAPTASQ